MNRNAFSIQLQFLPDLFFLVISLGLSDQLKRRSNDDIVFQLKRIFQIIITRFFTADNSNEFFFFFLIRDCGRGWGRQKSNTINEMRYIMGIWILMEWLKRVQSI